MFLLNRRTFIQLTGASALSGVAGQAQAALSGTDVFTADDSGALVDSTVIMGEREAVLVDAQINAIQASKVADLIEATGRKLTHVFITHYHPDHNLGLGTIMERFPDVRPVTHAAIRPGIEAAVPAMLAQFSSGAPAGVFPEKAVIPDALDANHILLEGERIEVLDPMQGDTALISALHVPSLDTLIASDFVYADTHAWTESVLDDVTADAWLKNLDTLEAMGAKTVIPGHRLPNSPNDVTGISQTRAYLRQWKSALASTSTREELQAAMMAGNEERGLVFALQRALGAVYPE